MWYPRRLPKDLLLGIIERPWRLQLNNCISLGVHVWRRRVSGCFREATEIHALAHHCTEGHHSSTCPLHTPHEPRDLGVLSSGQMVLGQWLGDFSSCILRGGEQLPHAFLPVGSLLLRTTWLLLGLLEFFICFLDLLLGYLEFYFWLLMRDDWLAADFMDLLWHSSWTSWGFFF